MYEEFEELLMKLMIATENFRKRPPIYLKSYVFAFKAGRSFITFDRKGNYMFGIKGGDNNNREFQLGQDTRLTFWYFKQRKNRIAALSDLYLEFDIEKEWIEKMKEEKQPFSGTNVFVF